MMKERLPEAEYRKWSADQDLRKRKKRELSRSDYHAWKADNPPYEPPSITPGAAADDNTLAAASPAATPADDLAQRPGEDKKEYAKRVLGEDGYRTYKAERKARKEAKGSMDRADYEQYKADNPFTVYLPGEDEEAPSTKAPESTKAAAPAEDLAQRPGEDKKAYAKRVLGEDGYRTYKAERKDRQVARKELSKADYEQYKEDNPFTVYLPGEDGSSTKRSAKSMNDNDYKVCNVCEVLVAILGVLIWVCLRFVRLCAISAVSLISLFPLDPRIGAAMMWKGALATVGRWRRCPTT